jgi:hypothetical protein
MIPTIVSFYTPAYLQQATALRDSLHDFGLDCRIELRPDAGSWFENVRQKPYFIEEQLKRYNDPLCWVDADATIEKKPVLLADLSRYDIAIHYRNGKELLSGTVYFNTTRAAMDIIDSWKSIQLLRTDWAGQRCLERALGHVPRTKIFHLPKEYCQIVAPGKVQMGNPETAVIAHHQASRTFRRKR